MVSAFEYTRYLNCWLCEKVCPLDEGNIERKNLILNSKVRLPVKDDTIRGESTSGGAFIALAEDLINTGGVVFEDK